MITVNFELSDNRKTICMTVDGHALAGKKGEDIICSAASILVYTVAQFVAGYRDAGKLKKKPNIKLEEGHAVVTAKPAKDLFNEAMHTFYVAEIGFRILAESYPEYIEIKKCISG